MNRDEKRSLWTAIAATACCTLPLIAVALGISGAVSGLLKLDILYFPLAAISLAFLTLNAWKNLIQPARRGEYVDIEKKKHFSLIASIIIFALATPWLIPLLQCADCY